MIKQTHKISFFLFTLLLTLMPCWLSAAEIDVFILHSYHQEYPWTKQENRGIINTLNTLFQNRDVSYRTEYLDTKRVQFDDDYQLFYKNYLQQKYLDYKPDLIFLTDDNALLFFLRYQEELFGDTPTIFCGVNDASVVDAIGEREIYGVFEMKDIALNLKLIDDIMPADTERVIFVGDDSVTYQAIHRQINEYRHKFAQDMEYLFVADSRFDNVSQKLSELGKGIVVLTTIGSFDDNKGRTLTIPKAITGIRSSGNFSIISMEDVYMLDGVLGGIVTSGVAQGRTAAEKGFDLYLGKNTEVKRFEQGPNVPTFSHPELEKHNISWDNLPDGAKIQGKPVSFYDEFKNIVYAAFFTFIIMLLLLLFLSLSIVRRREAETELVESENFLSSVLDNLPDLVFVKDAEDLRFVRLNKVAETVFGVSQKDILGKTDFDFFPAEEAHFYQNKDRQTLEGKVLVDIPTEPIQTPEGRRYLHTKKIPVLDGQGKPLYLLGISRDITEILNEEQHRIELEEKLKQAQKMESIGTLAGGIAHDFNNILSSIIGYTELAQRQANEPEVVTKMLDGSLKGAERAKQLVRQILTFSRKAESKRVPVILANLISEGLKLLRSSLPSSINIKERLASEARVLADPTQMHQIIMNLGTNGYQAMLNGGGTLLVTLDEVSYKGSSEPNLLGLDRGKYLYLSIQDNGRGMDRETLERMFDPYFTTKGPESGTGLGLAVVHGIVKNHGGYISVISEVNVGTTVDIYLPITDEELKVDEKKKRKNIVDGGTESILLVDDEPDIIETTQWYLRSNGYKVKGFTRSGDALIEFKKDPDAYDLVITDMTMPQMLGTELALEILQIRPELPIILCTGHNDAINRGMALEMGIKAYCEKPMNIDEILKTIRAIFDA